jgi:dolichol kinase
MMKDNLEVRRQIFHSLLGVATVGLLSVNLVNGAILFFAIILGIIFSLLSRKHKIPVIYWFLDKFERAEDLKRFPGKGVIHYLLGVFLVVVFFPLDMAMAAIMVLALGDSASNLFGARYGKTPHPFTSRKNLEGLFAGIAAGFLGALVFVKWYEALFASFIAMVVEGIEMKIGVEEVDDNVIIPIVAAAVILGIRMLI